MNSDDLMSIIISCVAILSVLAVLTYWTYRRTEIKKMEVSTRLAMANDGRLRELTEASVAAQTATTEQIAALRATLSDFQNRLSSIERLLRDVDA